MGNPYAAPETELIDKNKKKEVLDKEQTYKKYRDQVRTYFIFTMLLVVFFSLMGESTILIFVPGLICCLGGLLFSWKKMKAARLDYLDELKNSQ